MNAVRPSLQVVAALIPDAQGRILLAERPPGKRLAGFWELPGGKVETTETLEAALERELLEELRLPIQIKKFIGSFRYAHAWGEIDLNVFLAESAGPPKLTEAVAAFAWVPPAKIDWARLSPGDWAPIQTYLKDLKIP